MISGTIGKQTIEVVLGGIAALQKQLDNVGASIQKTADKAKAIGQSASSAFSQASSAVLGFARVADPLGSLQLDIAFARLSVQIGRVFIPVLHDATAAITQVANWLSSLSDETRESALWWTKLGLAVTGGLAVLGKVLSVGSGVVAIFTKLGGLIASVASGFWSLLGFLGPWGRIAVIVGGVVAALVGLRNAGDDAGSVIGKLTTGLKNAWNALKNLFSGLWDLVAPALAKLKAGFEDASEAVYTALVAVWARIGPAIMPLVQRIGSAVQAIWTAVSAHFQRVWGTAVDAFQVATDAIGSAFRKLEGLAEPVLDAISTGVNLVVGYIGLWEDALRALAGFFAPIGKAVGDVFDRMTSESSGFMNALRAVGDLGREIGTKFVEVWGKLAPTWEKLRSMAMSVFGGIKDFAQGLLDPLVSAFRELSGPLETLLSRLGELGGTIIRLFGSLADVVGNTLGKAFVELKTVVGPIFDWLGRRVKEFVDALSAAFNYIYEPIKTVFNAIQRGFASVVNFIKEAFFGMIEGITNVINKFIDGINSLVKKLDKISPIDLPEVSKFNVGEKPKALEPEQLPDIQRKNNNPHNIQELPPIKGKVLPDHPQFNENTFFPGAKKPDEKTKPNEGFFSRMAAMMEKGKPDEKGSKFQGQLLGNARFTGIADAMRQAQQSTVPDKNTAILIESQKIQGQQVTLLEEIRDDIRNKRPSDRGMLVV